MSIKITLTDNLTLCGQNLILNLEYKEKSQNILKFANIQDKSMSDPVKIKGGGG